jgi:UDP-2,3-diacylglucosamine pyrophosphatase LpxH
MQGSKIIHSLAELHREAPVLPIGKKDRMVIFSDLHMGNGSSRDDFLPNAALFKTALKDYYLPHGFHLILNGDVEELQRFEYRDIQKRWESTYKTFDLFAQEEKLTKIIGNHDIGLKFSGLQDGRYPLYDAVNVAYKEKNLFVFHGHQASEKYTLHNALIGYTLRYLANPLGIKNYSVSHSSKKQYAIERNVYLFSQQQRIASIIGHTHRPLFESLPKLERIKYRIEQLCREYSARELEDDESIRKLIQIYKKEVETLFCETTRSKPKGYIYNQAVLIPCLFNSGCVIGKRGMTALEIKNGKISLVHWFDKKISKKYLNHQGYVPQAIEGSDCYRMILNKEKLNYIFTRIDLLS